MFPKDDFCSFWVVFIMLIYAQLSISSFQTSFD